MYKHICKECEKEFESKCKTSTFCSNNCKYKYLSNKRKKDISGQKFGRLTAINCQTKNRKTYWNCICECGKITSVQLSSLVSGTTKSCGCLHKEITKNRGSLKEADLSLLNKKFNMLKVVDFSGYKCVCKCDCGNIIELYPSELITGHTKSCGCLKKKSASNRMKKISKLPLADGTNISRIASTKLRKK